MEIYVSVHGNDKNNGTLDQPFRTIEQAKREAGVCLKASAGKDAVKVLIQEGTYYLKEPLVFGDGDSGTAESPVLYEGIGKVVISGGMPLNLQWKPWKEDIFCAKVLQGISFDQLFANGERQVLARYPSYDEGAGYYNGYAPDSFDKERIARYKNPEGGFMHAMHEGLCGDFQYEITGKDSHGELQYRGGHQNNRTSKMHESIRYIENIFEELNSEKEWYLDREESVIYYKPPAGMDIESTVFEGAVLKNLITFRGSKNHPVSHIRFKNLSFTHTGLTFMEQMEPLLRSDWMVYRGGAVLLEETESISIEDCSFDQVGGNAVFISGYNFNSQISSCFIKDAGASAILFIGRSSAVRAPLFSYEEVYRDKFDTIPGPDNCQFPIKCCAYDNLIIRCGRFEKQTAGVCISIAKDLTISHNTIYEVPRAGINICDGCFGGHIIEHNCVFDTVLETSDHGAFNSWGRDRYWDYRYDRMKDAVEQEPELPYLDAVSKSILRNNCFACSHGRDIDLDDGSSNYEIYQNLCLEGGIKNREGFKRIVHHNILLNNTYHPHVWFADSKDRFYSNIVFQNYADIGLNGWGDEFNYNILHDDECQGPAIPLQKKSKMDQNSIYQKVEFENTGIGDFTVKLSRQIEEAGFHNFEMKIFGVISERLKALSRTPFGSRYKIKKAEIRDDRIHEFEGMLIKNLAGPGEISATGMYQECGVYIQSIKKDSIWYEKGFHKNDVILSANDTDINRTEEWMVAAKKGIREAVIWRQQGKHIIYM